MRTLAKLLVGFIALWTAVLVAALAALVTIWVFNSLGAMCILTVVVIVLLIFTCYGLGDDILS